MKYFSTFSGIGGFEHGIEKAYTNIYKEYGLANRQEKVLHRQPESNTIGKSHERQRTTCVGYSEIDKYASAIYNYHYPNHKNYGDITSINVRELPNFDLFVGGFPCQAFSIAGRRQGFKDTRGTLFFDVARILKAKQPEWVLLENVKGLLNHDAGKTIGTIFGVLTELGYSVGWEVVNSCHFGVPQNRERIFIVGHLRSAGGRSGEIFPIREDDQLFTAQNGSEKRLSQAELSITVRDGIGSKADGTYIISGTWRTHKDGEGFREVESGLAPTIPARAREDGSGQPVILAHYGHKDKPPVEHKISPTLKAQSHGHEPMVKAVLTPDRLEKRQNGRRFKDNDEPSFTLTSQDKHGVQIGTSIRRLTPIECERLQGFPDGWTAKGIIDGKEVEISDTQRYKVLGNAVTTNVITAIITKIMNVHHDS